jgi:hypothetical protein
MSLGDLTAVPPYPPARYTVDEAEVGAWLKRGDAAPDYDAFGAWSITNLASHGDSGGDVGCTGCRSCRAAGVPALTFTAG